MSEKLDGMLSEYDRLSLRIAFNPATQTYLKSSNSAMTSHKPGVYALEKVITHEQGYLPNDLFIDMLDNHGQFIFSLSDEENDIAQKVWFQNILSNRGKLLWTTEGLADLEGVMDRNEIRNGLLGARQVLDYYSTKKIGIMFLVIPMQAVESIIGDSMIHSKDKIQVIDQFGYIAYSSELAEIGTRADNNFFASIYLQGKNGKIAKETIDGKQMYVSSYTSNYSKWTSVRYIDIDENLGDLINMQRSILAIGVAGVLVSLIFIYSYSYTLSLPIRHLASRLANIKRGKLIPYRGNMKSREVSVLYASYNAMIEDLDKTIKDLSYRQIRESEARLLALKAQFQPHFLYNTLNTIYFYAIKEKQNNVSRMVLSLSELLRYSIQPGSEFIRLKDDLEQLNRFIELQYFRYEDKLNIEIEVAEELLDYPVMKLILQPLVENAITHGLEKMKGKPWLIRIQIVKSGDRLHFTIEDNGKGMSPEEMKLALEFQFELDTEKTMHAGVGLPNLQHRIKLIYGDPYGLVLSASTLGGLKVQLEIPIRTDERAEEIETKHTSGG